MDTEHLLPGPQHQARLWDDAGDDDDDVSDSLSAPILPVEPPAQPVGASNHGNQENSRGDLGILVRNLSQGGRGRKTNRGYHLYPDRWYVLLVFSLIALLQNCTWNTWGPIQDTASIVLGWSPGQFALLANWGPITFIISAFFFSWLLHAKGLRVSVLLTGGLLVVGLAIRCIPVPVSKMKWTMNVGHVFIGLAGPIAMAAPTTISAAWFPVNERTTATAIAATFQTLGVASSFVIGPQIVGDFPPENSTTTPSPGSFSSPSTASGENASFGRFSSDQDEYDKHLKEIRLLMYIEFSLTALVFLSAVIYFPATPPTPPTASAVVKRENMKAGLVGIVKKLSFWIPALAYAINTGVFGGWSTQMVGLFSNVELDQTSIGWIGFFTNIAAVMGGMATGRCADYLGGKMKAILLFLIAGSSAFLIWTILILNNFIPYNKVCLYVSVIMFGFLLSSTVPLFYEITVEGAFPIGEETTTMCMTLLNNFGALIFLVLVMIPSIDTDYGWLNWFMLGSSLVTIPLLLMYKEHYSRMDYDASHSRETATNGAGIIQ